MEKPLVEQKQSIAIESLMQPSLNVSQGEKNVSRTSESLNSNIELSRENNISNVGKKRTKPTSTKSKEKTSDIWEKVNRKSF